MDKYIDFQFFTDKEILELHKQIIEEISERDSRTHPAGKLQRQAEVSLYNHIGDIYYGKPSPKKAVLILEEKDRHGNHWVGGDQKIEIKDESHLSHEVFEWLESNNLPKHFLKYAYFDGILFEYMHKPVLADVLTGIEI